MRIYLDNCAFNRPFDDQGQIRIRLEAEAKLYLQDKIRQGTLELIWSYILEFENEANPFLERQAAIREWRSLAVVEIEENASVLKIAKSLLRKGVKAKDALHVASAIEGCADYFVTTDDRLIKKLSDLTAVQIINPLDIIGLINGYVN
ncbi:MAG: type II toxin-antitoxin system VapC family toxin [Symploca sp. SIO2G7]|nr:type II toxin-antitoxin system VapC family toxin [Symploca sp. SIO2G7]